MKEIDAVYSQREDRGRALAQEGAVWRQERVMPEGVIIAR